MAIITSKCLDRFNSRACTEFCRYSYGIKNLDQRGMTIIGVRLGPTQLTVIPPRGTAKVIEAVSPQTTG